MENKKTLIIIGIVVLGIVGLGFILYLNVRPEPLIQGVIQFPRPSRGHDDDREYLSDEYALPPPGGIHWNIWQNCGVYDQPIDTGYVMHSMEHGAAWISYQPDLPADEVALLQDRVEGVTHLLLAPYPDLQSPVVLSAWGVQLEVDDANDGRIDQFIDRYRLSPQSPEPGAACTNGVGDPIDRNVPSR